MDSPSTTDGSRSGEPDPLLYFAFLGGGIVYVPGLIFVERSAELSRGYRLGAYMLLVAGALCLLIYLLTRLGFGLARATLAVGIAWFLSAGAGPLVGDTGELQVAGIVVIVIAAITSYRLAHMGILRGAIAILTVVLIGSPVVEGVASFFGSEPSALLMTGSHEDVRFEERPASGQPDVWFVVVDGYPSDFAISQHYGSMEAPLSSYLAREGFAANGNALSPHPVTHLSVPALLNAQTDVRGGMEIGPSEMASARKTIDGGNLMAHSLRAVGYSTAAVENGWHLMGCASADRCLPPPLIDEQIALTLEHSLAGRMLGIDRDWAFASGVRHVLDAVATLADETGGNAQPDFVLVHLIAPHPPFGLTETCQSVALDDQRSGLAVVDPAGPSELAAIRRQLYLDQTECVVTQLSQLVSKLDDDTVVAIVGDHGPDSLNQLSTPVESWDQDMMAERLLTLAAVRGPAECEFQKPVWTLEVSRQVLDCVGAMPPDSEISAALSGLPAGGTPTPVVDLALEDLGALLEIASG